MVKFYRKSASLSALWVSTNDRLSDFYVSSWQRGESPTPMLMVRTILMCCAVAILVWSLLEGSSPYWLVYLTNWGILLVTATMISAFCVSITITVNRSYANDRNLDTCSSSDSDCPETTTLPWYVSTYWLLFNMSLTLSIMITALYWILLYSPEVHEDSENPVRSLWLDISSHGFTSCVMMAELLASRTPVRLAHIYQPLGMGLWYTLFSVIYYAAGGTDGNGNRFIYEVLNWQYGKRTTIVVICSVLGLILLYFLLLGIAFCRDKISIALVRTTSRDLPSPHHNQLSTRIV